MEYDKNKPRQQAYSLTTHRRLLTNLQEAHTQTTRQLHKQLLNSRVQGLEAEQLAATHTLPQGAVPGDTALAAVAAAATKLDGHTGSAWQAALAGG